MDFETVFNGPDGSNQPVFPHFDFTTWIPSHRTFVKTDADEPLPLMQIVDGEREIDSQTGHADAADSSDTVFDDEIGDDKKQSSANHQEPTKNHFLFKKTNVPAIDNQIREISQTLTKGQLKDCAARFQKAIDRITEEQKDDEKTKLEKLVKLAKVAKSVASFDKYLTTNRTHVGQDLHGDFEHYVEYMGSEIAQLPETKRTQLARFVEGLARPSLRSRSNEILVRRLGSLFDTVKHVAPLKDQPDLALNAFKALSWFAEEHCISRLSSLTPKQLGQLDSRCLRSLARLDLSRAGLSIDQLEVIDKEVSLELTEKIGKSSKITSKMVNAAIDKTLEQGLQPALKGKLESYSPERRNQLVAELSARSKYCSPEGLKDIFDRINDQLLSKGGYYHRFAEPHPHSHGQMVPKIKVLVTDNGIGEALAYLFHRHTQTHVEVYRLCQNIDGRPVIKGPGGTFLDARAVPHMVLLDRPTATGSMQELLRDIEKTGNLFVPTELVGSTDGKEKGFQDGVNFIDIAKAELDPQGMDDLIKKLELARPEGVPHKALELDKALLTERGIRQRIQHKVFLLKKPEEIVNRVLVQQAMVERSVSEFARLSKELYKSIDKKVRYLDKVTDQNSNVMDRVVFVLPPNRSVGSELLVRTLFRIMHPELPGNQFLTFEEASALAKDGKLKEKYIVPLDDGFDTGNDCQNNKLKPMHKNLVGDGQSKGLIFASLLNLEGENKIATTSSATLGVEASDLEIVHKIHFVFGEIEQCKTLKDALKQKYAEETFLPELLDYIEKIAKEELKRSEGMKEPSETPSKPKNTYRVELNEVFFALLPNNSHPVASEWYRDGLKLSGTRATKRYELWEMRCAIMPDYLKETSGKSNLTPEQKHQAFLTAVKKQIETNQSTDHVGKIIIYNSPLHKELMAMKSLLEGDDKMLIEDRTRVIDAAATKYLASCNPHALSVIRRDLTNSSSFFANVQDIGTVRYTFQTPDKTYAIKSIECNAQGCITVTFQNGSTESLEQKQSPKDTKYLKDLLARLEYNGIIKDGETKRSNFELVKILAAYVSTIHENETTSELKRDIRTGFHDFDSNGICSVEYIFKHSVPIQFGGNNHQIEGLKFVQTNESQIELVEATTHATLSKEFTEALVNGIGAELIVAHANSHFENKRKAELTFLYLSHGAQESRGHRPALSFDPSGKAIHGTVDTSRELKDYTGKDAASQSLDAVNLTTRFTELRRVRPELNRSFERYYSNAMSVLRYWPRSEEEKLEKLNSFVQDFASQVDTLRNNPLMKNAVVVADENAKDNRSKIVFRTGSKEIQPLFSDRDFLFYRGEFGQLEKVLQSEVKVLLQLPHASLKDADTVNKGALATEVLSTLYHQLQQIDQLKGREERAKDWGLNLRATEGDRTAEQKFLTLEKSQANVSADYLQFCLNGKSLDGKTKNAGHDNYRKPLSDLTGVNLLAGIGENGRLKLYVVGQDKSITELDPTRSEKLVEEAFTALVGKLSKELEQAEMENDQKRVEQLRAKLARLKVDKETYQTSAKYRESVHSKLTMKSARGAVGLTVTALFLTTELLEQMTSD